MLYLQGNDNIGQGSTGGNRRLAQWRVKWLIEHSTSHQLLWSIESLVLRNPPLRQAPKRCASLSTDRKPNRKMIIERKDLIELCDKFLQKEITKSELEFYALNAIMLDEWDWDDNDNVISETIFDWGNEIINFPINDFNMKLWKKRLETNVDELLEHNNWNIHIEKQKVICEKYKSKWKPISRNLKVGISDNLNLEKLNGLRHKTENGKVCWYIWSGKYSEKDDFFKPICAEHLLQKNPKIIKYLGLDDGFRFLITDSGYEDVWFDENLLET